MALARQATGSILIVEDDDDTREALSQLLRGQGHHVLDAAHGVEALNLLRWVRPALIITDLSMPVMTGWQLLERLAADPRLSKIPVIVLSADSASPQKDLCFLQKPVPAAVLLAEINARVVAALPQSKTPAA
jgi:CheY-like chemotaxis protein